MPKEKAIQLMTKASTLKEDKNYPIQNRLIVLPVTSSQSTGTKVTTVFTTAMLRRAPQVVLR